MCKIFYLCNLQNTASILSAVITSELAHQTGVRANDKLLQI